MGLRLKEGVNPEILRNYGFKTGREWAEQGERCLQGKGHEYMYGWYHKFLMDEEDVDEIQYADEEFDQPVVKITIRAEEKYNNDLYVDCVPWGTYHIGGSELDVLQETLFDLISDGILEKV